MNKIKDEIIKWYMASICIVSISIAIVWELPASTYAYDSGQVVELHYDTVLIEAKKQTEWTREELEDAIRAKLPDVFVKIAQCESGYNINAINAKTDDFGLLQINAWYWREEWEALGLDMLNVEDNIAMAVRVYEAQGLQAWSASKHCWGV